ncbi:hypothetical protein [Pectobacterium versatile]|uniref:Uncharacterized protein n=1 Tax=Pectobacterium versatile TaxID=2488639 RepID=A0A855MF38_9GAMM|nr:MULTISPECIES: hypothetical protein [Pectobacterium]MBA0184406.1 hypothetical protein [Pectobacterium versatile]MCA5931340.1 hypothetical protein [Pectobacterium versatile]MCA5948357.1 hypothetical protein [Pectobacterium versatile]MCA5952456.1 hypothetical protein [Pectobacterium versatile]MCL6339629.1 hypothetical protein [Pectobacterium carotovorum subsp. carotovorum]
MELLKKEYVGNAVTLFDVRLSEGEVTLYADCLELVIRVCSDNDISQNTECESKEELSWFKDSLVDLLKSIEHKDYLPERYKKL